MIIKFLCLQDRVAYVILSVMSNSSSAIQAWIYNHIHYFILLLYCASQWRIGVKVSSNSCKSIKAPYVSLVLSIADVDGQVSCYLILLE